MRNVINLQPELIGIENIDLDFKPDDIPALLIGLQHLHSDGDFREPVRADGGAHPSASTAAVPASIGVIKVWAAT